MTAPGYIEQNAPPSSYAIADALEGRPGAWPRVAWLTTTRAAMILPGLYLAGIRGFKLLSGATLGSVAITTILTASYARKRRAQREGA